MSKKNLLLLIILESQTESILRCKNTVPEPQGSDIMGEKQRKRNILMMTLEEFNFRSPTY